MVQDRAVMLQISSRLIRSRIWSIEFGHFQWPSTQISRANHYSMLNIL